MDNQTTLAVDVGGTGLKATVLDQSGQVLHERVRVDTSYPMDPNQLVATLKKLVEQLPHYDRVSVGFPGMVRDGKVLSAPHFISPKGPGGKPSAELTAAWSSFDLAEQLASAFDRPTRVANDADVQGSAVVAGKGLEIVITLGTGVGSAAFRDGKLLPHYEFAHHPLRKSLTYNEVLGEAARKKLGRKRWQKRVAESIKVIRALTFFDHLYIGGGNAARLDLPLPGDITIVDNSAGLIGGIKLWERLD